MKNPFVHKVGGVVSADIAVPDHEREFDFYSKILTTGDAPLWRDDLNNNQGNPVIGLGVRTPEYESLPLQWMPHFQVADVTASVAATAELGGSTILHNKSDDAQSQWAVLSDPSGAAFGVIPVPAGQPAEMRHAQPIGRIAWLSLTAPDAFSSCNFYQRVVGWTARSSDTAATEKLSDKFEMQIDEETSAATIGQHGTASDNCPPVWLIHLPVGDLTESLRRVRTYGGEVIADSLDRQYTIVRDPIGVYFALQSD